MNKNKYAHVALSSRFTLLKYLVIMPAILIILCVFQLYQAEAAANDTNRLEGSALINALKNGGYTLYFRHEATHWDQMDNIEKAGDWLSCDPSRVRQLSDTGRANARKTGRAIRSLGIPIGEVFASPYCRTVETARLMDVGKVTPTTEVMNLRSAGYFNGIPAIVNTAQTLLARTPLQRANTVVVSHGNVARQATQVSPAEGEGIVFKADGKGGFDFIGRLTAAQWDEFAEAMRSNKESID